MADIAALLEKANALPLKSGCYLMKNRDGVIIYVGKAKILKNRVTQYFRSDARHSEKTKRMVAHADDFEFIVTDNENEAFVLENSLIKLHQPRYNIKLKDSRNYPYIKITPGEYPRISMVRRRIEDRGRYFGPYSSSSAVYDILSTIYKTFRIASCKRRFPQDIGKERPCLYYHINRCCGPCTGNVPPEEYQAIFREIAQFLNGDRSGITRLMRSDMEQAAEELNFEKAARLRDRIAALEKIDEKQKVIAAPGVEQDVIGLYFGELGTTVTIFFIRGGRIVDRDNCSFPPGELQEADEVGEFIQRYYQQRGYIPETVLVSSCAGDEQELSEWLSGLAGHRVTLHEPQRGDLKRLCAMAAENAEQAAAELRRKNEKDETLLCKLADLLGLEVLPERIEAYDISNNGSDHITAGMICYQDGGFDRSAYRIFNIKDLDAPDDYYSMRDAIERRLKRALTDEGFARLPDLILVDGGAGQLTSALQAMENVGVDIPVFGMVKDDFHKTRTLVSRDGEINIAKEQAVFTLIYKIQEEVHRFTISRMDRARRKDVKSTVLTRIKGIGPARAKALLKQFGSIGAMRDADTETLAAVPGMTRAAAEELSAYLKQDRQEKKKDNGGTQA